MKTRPCLSFAARERQLQRSICSWRAGTIYFAVRGLRSRVLEVHWVARSDYKYNNQSADLALKFARSPSRAFSWNQEHRTRFAWVWIQSRPPPFAQVPPKPVVKHSTVPAPFDLDSVRRHEAVRARIQAELDSHAEKARRNAGGHFKSRPGSSLGERGLSTEMGFERGHLSMRSPASAVHIGSRQNVCVGIRTTLSLR